MLTTYQQQTQRLLNDESTQFFNIDDLTVYINYGRNDIARQTECLIANATVNTVVNAQTIPVASITPAGGSGLLSPINVRNVRSLSGSVSQRLEARSWQWFSNYYLNGSKSNQTGTPPTLWAQQSQGATGTIYIWPTPSAISPLIIEATWTPISLVDDTTVEALPYPWTDIVPYFAAYQAYLQAQRVQDAANLLSLYNKFMMSGQLGITPQWMPGNFPTPKPLQSPIDQSATLAGQAGKLAQKGEGAL